MSRTLNPHLFGPIDTPVVQVDPSYTQNNKRFRDLEMQIDNMNQKLDKWAKMLEGKVQQLHHSQKLLNDHIKQVSANFTEQQAAILSKLNERRTSEVKTQELFDRHNQVINNFEMKIQQIQKVATEQEMKLIAYQATYDEILREIRNLR